MKKLLQISLIAILISSTAFALTTEEKNTVSKLKAWGVIEKTRTESEWQRAPRAIDWASGTIKAIDFMDQANQMMYENILFDMNDAFISLYDWQSRTEQELTALRAENNRLRRDTVSALEDVEKELGEARAFTIFVGVAAFLLSSIF